jgi:hypothetical protein
VIFCLHAVACFGGSTFFLIPTLVANSNNLIFNFYIDFFQCLCGSTRNVVRSRRNPKDACDLSSRHELLTEVDSSCHPGELI